MNKSLRHCRGGKMDKEGVVVARYLWLYFDRFRLDRRGRIEIRPRTWGEEESDKQTWLHTE